MTAAKSPLIKQGWIRTIIYLLIWFIVLGLAESLVVLMFRKGEESENALVPLLLSVVVSTSLTVAVTYFMRRFFDRQTFVSLGFEWKNYRADGWTGFFAAVALLGLGSLVLATYGFITFLSVNVAPADLILELLLMIMVAFSEELVMRGYVLNNLMQSTNKWIALSVSAVLFALFHLANPNVSVLSFVNILAAGILLGINYIHTKNLWFGIFFHFAWNFFQGPILGYEVSGLNLSVLFEQHVQGAELYTGGEFGFEGSVVCLIMLVVATIILANHYAKRYS